MSCLVLSRLKELPDCRMNEHPHLLHKGINSDLNKGLRCIIPVASGQYPRLKWPSSVDLTEYLIESPFKNLNYPLKLQYNQLSSLTHTHSCGIIWTTLMGARHVRVEVSLHTFMPLICHYVCVFVQFPLKLMVPLYRPSAGVALNYLVLHSHTWDPFDVIAKASC